MIEPAEYLLCRAAIDGDLCCVKRLVQEGADLQVSNSEGQSPLHCAAFNNNLDVVSFLVDEGASIDAKDATDWTPLSGAVWQDHFETVSYLLSQGAEVKNSMLIIASLEMAKILKLAAEKRDDERARIRNEEIKLLAADSLEDVEACVSRNVNVNTTDAFGRTPLMKAATNGALCTVKYLIKKNADIEAVNGFGWTPLHCAYFNDHFETAKYLIEDVKVNVNAQTINGWTILHRAAVKGHSEDMLFFLKNGAEEKVKDSWGNTALDLL